jgi:hypothetical protein
MVHWYRRGENMIIVGGIALAVAAFAVNNIAGAEKPTAPVIPVHVDNSFQFLVHAPLSVTAPLFGPEGEQGWAGSGWDPQFLYPRPGKDMEGAVFTVQQGKHTSVWVATVLDLAGGRMQYVSVVPGVRLSIVDVHLTARDASTTGVEVRYARTALDVSANEEVRALGESDRQEGPHWQEAVESYLRGQRGGK